jgi:hypothetical protein
VRLVAADLSNILLKGSDDGVYYSSRRLYNVCTRVSRRRETKLCPDAGHIDTPRSVVDQNFLFVTLFQLRMESACLIIEAGDGHYFSQLSERS